MFAKTIIDSDAFLDMPANTQLLYFHLSMRADDDGFINNPKKIQRMVGCSDDDIKLLIAKKFIIPFESGIVVIKHWKIHNYIAKDRYTETKYKEEKGMLMLDENNAYSLESGVPLGEYVKEKKPLTEAQQKRLDAKKESELPYAFDYKIRTAFVGEICPVCGCVMGYSNNLTKPTIQHNVPISKGGKHEIDNISVICASCNSSVQNREETEPLNTELVKTKWECIEQNGNVPGMHQECIGNVPGMYTQVRIGKVRIGKDSIGKDNNNVSENELSTGYDEPLSTVLGKIIKEKWKRTPTENEISLAIQLVGKLNGQVSMLADALDIAAQYGSRAKNWKYVSTIVDSWIQKGYKTEEDVLMHELSRKGGAR